MIFSKQQNIGMGSFSFKPQNFYRVEVYFKFEESFTPIVQKLLLHVIVLAATLN